MGEKMGVGLLICETQPEIWKTLCNKSTLTSLKKRQKNTNACRNLVICHKKWNISIFWSRAPSSLSSSLQSSWMIADVQNCIVTKSRRIPFSLGGKFRNRKKTSKCKCEYMTTDQESIIRERQHYVPLQSDCRQPGRKLLTMTRSLKIHIFNSWRFNRNKKIHLWRF